MRAWRFVRLFDRIFGPAEKLHVVEIEAMGLLAVKRRAIRMAVESGLEFPPGAFPVIKSLMYLDGMALACAPDQVLLDDVVKLAGGFDGARGA